MSLLEELKKNDLYVPYEKKLDQLLKGGPGSGPHPGVSGVKSDKTGKKSSSGTRRAEDATSSKQHERAADAHSALVAHLRSTGVDQGNVRLHQYAAGAHSAASSGVVPSSVARRASAAANGNH